MTAQRRAPSASGLVFDVTAYTLLVLFAVSFIYPFWNLILLSFSPQDEVSSLGLHVWIFRWNTGSWRYVLRNNQVGRAYLNTVYRAVVGTLLTIFITMTGAYALSKPRLPGRAFFSALFVLTMFFSGGLVPRYLLVRWLGLMNTRWALILPRVMNVFYIIIARNFLMAIDQALEDSAVIDGAGYWTVLFRIIVPVSKPVIATIALWTAVSLWNEWFDALIFIEDEAKNVLQILIRKMMQHLTLAELGDFADKLVIQESIPPQSVRAVTVLVTIGPVILVYPFAQKYFVKGIMLGSVKG